MTRPNLAHVENTETFAYNGSLFTVKFSFCSYSCPTALFGSSPRSCCSPSSPQTAPHAASMPHTFCCPLLFPFAPSLLSVFSSCSLLHTLTVILLNYLYWCARTHTLRSHCRTTCFGLEFPLLSLL